MYPAVQEVGVPMSGEKRPDPEIVGEVKKAEMLLAKVSTSLDILEERLFPVLGTKGPVDGPAGQVPYICELGAKIGQTNESLVSFYRRLTGLIERLQI
jgi:hypothetical protein